MLSSTASVPGSQGLSFPRDLPMEGHLRALALWYYLISLVLMAMVVLFITEGIQKDHAFAGNMVMSAIFILVAAGFASLGCFLSRYSDSARFAAKVLTIVWLVLSLPGSLLGAFGAIGDWRVGEAQTSSLVLTVGGGLMNLGWQLAILWVVDSERTAEICTPEYRSNARSKPGPSGFSSPLFWLPLGLAGGLALLGAVARQAL
jgi:hypothetical protein